MYVDIAVQKLFLIKCNVIEFVLLCDFHVCIVILINPVFKNCPAQYWVSWCTSYVSLVLPWTLCKELISGLLVHRSSLCPCVLLVLGFFSFFYFLESHLNVVGFILVDRRHLLQVTISLVFLRYSKTRGWKNKSWAISFWEENIPE